MAYLPLIPIPPSIVLAPPVDLPHLFDLRGDDAFDGGIVSQDQSLHCGVVADHVVELAPHGLDGFQGVRASSHRPNHQAVQVASVGGFEDLEGPEVDGFESPLIILRGYWWRRLSGSMEDRLAVFDHQLLVVPFVGQERVAEVKGQMGGVIDGFGADEITTGRQMDLTKVDPVLPTDDQPIGMADTGDSFPSRDLDLLDLIHEGEGPVFVPHDDLIDPSIQELDEVRWYFLLEFEHIKHHTNAIGVLARDGSIELN